MSKNVKKVSKQKGNTEFMLKNTFTAWQDGLRTSWGLGRSMLRLWIFDIG